MDLRIRNATIEDAAAVCALLNPIIETGRYTAFDTPFSVTEEAAFIDNQPERGLFLVAEESATGRILGFQTLTPYADYTHAFDHVGVIGTFVDMALHRKGIAARIFDATYARARGLGYAKIFAFVRADNDAGLAAYTRQGFRSIGIAEKQACIDGHYIDEIIIEKWIAEDVA